MKCLKPFYVQGYGHVPCGRCMACRINRTYEWSMRILHEAALHESNCFITLTYDDEHLPANGSLEKAEMQKWIKRYRKILGDKRIKYYICGEYGDKSERPHYHAIILGDRPSKETLEKTWKYGFVQGPGTVTYESCAYVSAYVQKKLGGPMAKEQYEKRGREPPFQLCSQGLGYGFVLLNRNQMLVNGYVTMNGKKSKIPRYYYNKIKDDIPLEKINAEKAERLEILRENEASRGLDPLEEWKRERDAANQRYEEISWKQKNRRRKL